MRTGYYVGLKGGLAVAPGRLTNKLISIRSHCTYRDVVDIVRMTSVNKVRDCPSTVSYGLRYTCTFSLKRRKGLTSNPDNWHGSFVRKTVSAIVPENQSIGNLSSVNTFPNAHV